MFKHSFKAMGTLCNIHLQGDSKLIQQVFIIAEQEVRRLEQKYSRYRDDSVTTQINSLEPNISLKVDPETAALLNYTAICYEQSDGLFDITSGVFRKIWDFKSNRLPTDSQIKNTLNLVGWDKIHWDGENLALPIKGMEIDFGGVVKEFAADRVAELCRQSGIQNGLVDLGGDMCVVGPHINSHSKQPEPWKIGIRNPEKPEEAIATIPLIEGALATSGYYERFMMIDGKRYCHIINPKTGWPVSWCASVSVVSSQCLVSGSLATIALLKEQSAPEWLEDQEAPFLLISHKGKITGTLYSG